MLIYLMAVLGLIVMIAGIALFALRRSGIRWRPSREDEETKAGLQKAFGKDMKWGSPGSAEDEFRDRNLEHSDFESLDSGSED